MRRCQQSAIALTFLLTLLVCRAGAAPTDDERLDTFLHRLGLVDLQTLHLEDVLDQQTESLARQNLAKRLADIYAGQLLTHSGDKAKYERVLRKIDQLMTSVPSAKTPSLEVMLLQADYSRAEGLIGEWMADRSNDSSLTEAADILTRIAPELDRLQKGLSELAEKLLEGLDALDDGPERDAKLQELRQLQPVVGRATYFAAWSNYYLGLTKESQVAYQRAQEIYRQLFGLGNDYSEDEAEYLGLESIWKSRSLIGLALTEAALGDRANCEACFTWLGHASVPPEIRQQVPYWRLQALLNSNQLAAARSFAQEYVAAFDDRATQDRVSFCISLIQAAFGGGKVDQKLGTIGLGGLIKIGQRQTAKRLMEKYKVQIDDNADFYLLWLRAQQLFELAERTKKAPDYEAAKAAYQVAIPKSSEISDLSAIGQAYSQAGWCYFRLGEHASAGDKFRFAADRLIIAKDRRAIDSAWMAFVSFQEAAKKNPTLKQNAIDALKTIKREFPDSKYAKQADYFIGKLRKGSSPEETMRSLELVKPGTPNYLSARFEISTLRYQEWNKAKKESKSAIGKQVVADVDTYLKAATGEAEAGRRARANLIAADVSLQSGATAEAEAYVQQTDALLKALPTGSSTVAEYHYRALQIAQKLKNDPQQQMHADWIVKNGGGSRFELPAIIVMARLVDQGNTAAGRNTESIRKGYQLYKRLVELLGDSQEHIRANKNAQVANSKLAHYASQLGRNAEAAARLDKLLAAGSGSKNRSYLRRAGLAHYNGSNYEAALGPWRTLLRGVTKGSDEWFEAKYYQLACLFKTDATKAKSVFEQFKLLYPKLGGEKWRDKFTALSE